MRHWTGICILALVQVGFAQSPDLATPTHTASGTVFEDKNRNGKRDDGEPGIAGISVSNQHVVVKTDRQGRWKLPHDDDTIFFVVKPRNWMTPVDEHQRPLFYYVHKPKGSPPDLRFAGVEPTGPLPESIDFPLHRTNEPDAFSALFFGDTQTRDLREVGYVARDLVEPIANSKEVFNFGVTLGDIVFDDLSVTEPLVKTIGLIGIPWYYVLGNHDQNYDAKHDGHADEHWERVFGPSYYSFDHGQVHFVVLDDVIWVGKDNAQKENPDRTGGYYHAGLGPKQMAWLKNDLALVPAHKLVVLMMHIPMNEMRDKAELFKILGQRPYSLSVSAHTHTQEHRFFTDKDGWQRPEPHHHVVNVTACGSWWGGAPDENGVPNATMSDGAPNGFSVFSFDGNQYSIEFRAANRPRTYQMNVVAPEVLNLGDVRGTTVFANVFGGSERSKVEYSFAGGPWREMERSVERDPSYLALYGLNSKIEKPYRGLAGPGNVRHLWKGVLTERVKPGVHALHVRTTDMFGQSYTATRAIRVE